jgi:hypothetical protein
MELWLIITGCLGLFVGLLCLAVYLLDQLWNANGDFQ